jgi:hypothetical protein
MGLRWAYEGYEGLARGAGAGPWRLGRVRGGLTERLIDAPDAGGLGIALYTRSCGMVWSRQ